jgi:hypothetical protein
MDTDRWSCRIPKLFPMEQVFADPTIRDPKGAAFAAISSALGETEKIKDGSSVAITVGSRGIGNIAEIIAGVVEALKKRGCHPFIVPAMGSHGSENPLGKVQILSHLGVTEDSVGAPISRSTEVILAGKMGETPVYCHAEARAADAIILVNRVKPHTDFRGAIESGLTKMAVLGLGGELGARWIHAQGYDQMVERIRKAGEAAIQTLPIFLGLAIVEGASHHPSRIEAIRANEISTREQILLKEARGLVPKLPIRKLDVLVVAEMGKDISGTGLDPAVTGRYPSGKPIMEEEVPDIHRIVVLDLTEASSGNSSGIGLCDITTRRLQEKTNFRVMYKNVITSRGAASGRLPMAMESDQEAICVGLLTCPGDPEDIGIALIRNTLQLERFLVSESLVAQCEKKGAKMIGKPTEISFDSAGSLIWPEWIRN